MYQLSRLIEEATEKNNIKICINCEQEPIHCKERCRKCYDQWSYEERKKKLLSDELVECKCKARCGKLIPRFTINGNIAKYKKGHFNKGRPNPRFRGRNNPKYKGGEYVTYNGYILKWAPRHPDRNGDGYIYKHRWVMEKKICRRLTKKEVVHHIDGNPKNNRKSNLKLYSNNREHLRDTIWKKDI